MTPFETSQGPRKVVPQSSFVGSRALVGPRSFVTRSCRSPAPYHTTPAHASVLSFFLLFSVSFYNSFGARPSFPFCSHLLTAALFHSYFVCRPFRINNLPPPKRKAIFPFRLDACALNCSCVLWSCRATSHTHPHLDLNTRPLFIFGPDSEQQQQQ